MKQTTNCLQMPEEKLKSEFIKYFGEEKWNEEEEIEKLFHMHLLICDFLNIDPIPVIVEKIDEDSRYDIKKQCIIILPKKIKNHKEALKCLIHETRHYYQLNVVAYEDILNPLYNIWKENLLNPVMLKSTDDLKNNDLVLKYMMQPIELDAFAFTKYFFAKFLNKSLICFHQEIENIFDLYIQKYFE